MSVQQFCLRWNNHQPNFISVCSSLLHNGTLVDVTLAAEGRQLQAHKIVLSACSSYFQTLFASNPCQHPIVILKDVQYNDLKTMVDFMYYGEVNVSQEQLPHILKTAEMLKIKGLAEMPQDAATLTKSDSKTTDQTEQLHAGSGTESLWGSADSQFQHQQQQQQQHQQHQQQQHHHHHHTQSQSHHNQRRSPSPNSGIIASPATRRKRIRKSSNNGSGERNPEEHGSIDASNISLAQMSQMSFAGNANLSHAIQTKIIKDSGVSGDGESHPQDSSQESMDEGHHHHLHIKPESDMGVPQSLPLDITDTPSSSDHDAPSVSCPQSQSSHTGVQWTVVDSNYPRFSLTSCQANIIGGNNANSGTNTQTNETASNSAGSSGGGGNSSTGDHQQQQQQQQQQNTNVNNHNASAGNTVVTSNPHQGQIHMHYHNAAYPSQIISVNNLVGGYSQNMSTPTSPNDPTLVQSVYSQGPTPTQSPNPQLTSVVTNPSKLVASSSGAGSSSSASGSSNIASGSQATQQQQKRKRSVNPQGDENFIQALEAVRTGGIGFCKAARLYGVNNRTLWLEYKKRGYPISRPSIKNRAVKQENLSPSPTPTNDETNIENFEHINQPEITMHVPPTSDTPTPIMCGPHHPMNVMNFLDARQMEFTSGIHTIPRQRFTDGAMNVNSAAMNLQGLNFNSM